ncbi:hypothetical protein BDP27DRAFT_1424231 [Rhodocollybia butyracea]|uniref:F-box domain-containing protein n=1 Tax=Rhodocollybia butyracea TaxID=206335 RepID=A0A9P5U4W9_9AGAR|nr:hypothetical protein BDP27DRAFT_1424231 [Rhodocollybia butyracea]
MGQLWTLVNVDKTKTLGGSWGKLGEFFWSPSKEVLDRLSTPVNQYGWAPKLKSKDKRSPAAQTATLLTKLPVELLQAIAKELIDDFIDLMSFSLTCATMWEVAEGVRSLYIRIKLQHKSWKGTRILFLGHYARSLPQRLLTEEDKEKLTEMIEIQKFKSYCNEASDDVSVNSNTSESSVSLLKDALEKECLNPGVATNRLDLFDIMSYDLPKAYRQYCLELWRFSCGRTVLSLLLTTPKDRWILRNLTKKEFVIKSEGSTSSGLTQALFSLICWSDDSSISMACDESDAERMIRGPWAGDRIDLTVYSLHEHKNNPDWKDITNEVLAFLQRLAKDAAEGEDEGFIENVLPFW